MYGLWGRCSRIYTRFDVNLFWFDGGGGVMTKRILCFGILVALLLVLCAGNAAAQATASTTIQGTIVDQSDAAIKGARITLTSKEQGWTRNAESSDTGAYRFDLLPAGFYSIKVSAAGFAAVEANNVELQVGVIATQNFTLKA